MRKKQRVFRSDEEARDLMSHSVNLQAVVHNMLVAVPDLVGGNPSRFWRKLHEVREAINDPRGEQVRTAFVRSLTPFMTVSDANLEENKIRHDVGPDFRHLHDHPGTDCGGNPL